MVPSLRARCAGTTLARLTSPLPMPGLHGGMRQPMARIDCTDCNAYTPPQRKGKSMATLTIRNIDPEVQKRVRVRAAENGRSMEAELRQIIKDAVGNAPDATQETGRDLAEAIRRRFAPYGGVELDIPPREVGREPPDFST